MKPETDSKSESTRTSGIPIPARVKVPARRYGIVPTSETNNQVVPTAVKIEAWSVLPNFVEVKKNVPNRPITTVAVRRAMKSTRLSKRETRVLTAIPAETNRRAMPVMWRLVLLIIWLLFFIEDRFSLPAIDVYAV